MNDWFSLSSAIAAALIASNVIGQLGDLLFRSMMIRLTHRLAGDAGERAQINAAIKTMLGIQ